MALASIPPVAWQRRFDQILQEPGIPNRALSPKMLVELLPGILRLVRRSWQNRTSGFDPVNFFNAANPGPVMGVPLGGLGCGSITRGWQGDFRRWQMRLGEVHYPPVYADQFSLFFQPAGEPPQARVLYPGKPDNNQLSAWQWDLPAACGTYHALFPRAWTVYRQPLTGIDLCCHQVSPVIPHNYRESSFPAAVFDWTAVNHSGRPARFGLMMTFQNGWGTLNDTAGGHSNQSFDQSSEKGKAKGVMLRHHCRQVQVLRPGQTSPPEVFEDPLSFAIAAMPASGMQASVYTHFNPYGDGREIWEDFAADGCLEDLPDAGVTAPGEATAAAVAITAELQPGEQVSFPVALAWDMPVARSGFGTPFARRYSRFYSREEDAAAQIACDSLQHYPEWERAISDWQEPVLKDESLPGWYRMALFNELYYLAAGGTAWVYPIDSTPDDKDMGHFGYLEGLEYRMLNTYDVHFYASFALAALWPELELALQRDVNSAIFKKNMEPVHLVFSGKSVPRKTYGMVPHDLGWPDEDPWVLVNGYFFQDVNAWKDLNPKFVLQVMRDYLATGDRDFLKSVWPGVQLAIETIRKYDTDGDGLIENTGFPDQTYDTWAASGPSAYTGGLWLACLQAANAMAGILGEPVKENEYARMACLAARSYEEKLWNGQYYHYDASRSAHHDSIMADQLAGHCYARACGLEPLLNRDNVRSALGTIFNHNVKGFMGGMLGAVNGMRPDGRVDRTNLQSQEVWTGTTYMLAAAMLIEGMDDEAWAAAKGIVDTTYSTKGYWFQTPEAWNSKGNYRSLAYMRPLAIWAMQWALDLRRGKIHLP